jgi:hypothetical protein
MGRRDIARGLATAGGIGTAALAGVVLWASGPVEPELSAFAARHAVEALAVVAVVLLGVVLTGRGSELGVAVLVSAGVLAVPSLLGLTMTLSSLGAGLSMVAVVGAPHAALVAAGVVALTSRRRDRWRWDTPWSWSYAAAAVGVLAASWSPWVADPVLGAPGAVAVLASPRPAVWSISGLVSGGALLLVLLGAARLPRRLAAGLLTGVVARTLPASLLAVHQATGTEVVVTPSGWLMVVSATALLVVAVWWRDADRGAAHRRRSSLADAAGLP